MNTISIPSDSHSTVSNHSTQLCAMYSSSLFVSFDAGFLFALRFVHSIRFDFLHSSRYTGRAHSLFLLLAFIFLADKYAVHDIFIIFAMFGFDVLLKTLSVESRTVCRLFKRIYHFSCDRLPSIPLCATAYDRMRAEQFLPHLHLIIFLLLLRAAVPFCTHNSLMLREWTDKWSTISV